MNDAQVQCTAGIDVGSSAIKVVITRSRGGDEGEIVASASQRIRRRTIDEVVRATFAEACASAQVSPGALAYVATTGDAEESDLATGHFYGMTTHARGALFLDPEARTALDLGALHARAIKLDARGKVLGHRMTSQCASGSGQFLENIARYLGVPIEDVGALSLASTNPEEVSSICAVLAETDVINMVSRGLTTPDILKGIHLSIAGRLARLVRSAGAEGVVMLTGGMSADEGLVAALREVLAADTPKKGAKTGELTVRAHPMSALAGALGAALLAAYRYEQLRRAGRLEGMRAIPA
jgi:benzoyl-CoA reductase subunit D